MRRGNTLLTLPARGTTGRRTILALEEWPDLDQIGWRAATDPGARFDHKARAYAWRQSTAQNVARAYGLFLAWLEHRGDLDRTISPESRVTGSNIKAFVEQMRAWNQSPGTIASTLSRLAMAIKAISDSPRGDPHWKWLTTLSVRFVPRKTSIDLIESASATDTQGLFKIGQQSMDTAEAAVNAYQGAVSRESAVQFRDGLLVFFEAFALLRSANLLALRIGTSIIKGSENWRVHLTTKQTKTGSPIDFEVPQAISSAIDRYIEIFRPILAMPGDPSETALWLSFNGLPLSAKALWDATKRVTQRALGRGISSHRFRHIAAVTVATQAPERMRAVSAALSHGSMKTTLRYYELSDGIASFDRLHDVIDHAPGPISHLPERKAVRHKSHM
jgi:integrase/recombinase XerD